jgi:CDP-paratose 2-epimerase
MISKELVIVTGAGGLIGSEAACFFHARGFDVAGIDNDKRSYFFGTSASTAWKIAELQRALPNYQHFGVDITDKLALEPIFSKQGARIRLIVHCAAQPSHDWASREPYTDFSINATGTLHLLELTRTYCPEAVFIFTSTNKVYGDLPNSLPIVEKERRWEIDPAHSFAANGINESMSIDQCTHSLFGVSKTAADLMAQEYGRYFGLRTVIFRGGCLTGPSHSGAELHGFLAYLVQSAVLRRPYTIFGYKGKQVRDNIHSADLISAFNAVFEQPPVPGTVYNMGGSRHANISMLEAIDWLELYLGHPINYCIDETKTRKGDHIWYISDVRKFQQDYPHWDYKYSMDDILGEMVEATISKKTIS